MDGSDNVPKPAYVIYGWSLTVCEIFTNFRSICRPKNWSEKWQNNCHRHALFTTVVRSNCHKKLELHLEIRPQSQAATWQNSSSNWTLIFINFFFINSLIFETSEIKSLKTWCMKSQMHFSSWVRNSKLLARLKVIKL